MTARIAKINKNRHPKSTREKENVVVRPPVPKGWPGSTQRRAKAAAQTEAAEPEERETDHQRARAHEVADRAK